MDFDFTTETITPDITSVLTFGGQGIELPIGTTAQRPTGIAEGTLRFNSDQMSLEQYVDGSWIDVVDGNSKRLITAQLVKVQKDPGPGQFSSIADALASITDASSSKPYIIQVGPGVYTEPQIAMKPYVSVAGINRSSTIIQPSDPNSDLIIGSRFSELSNVTLRGATGSGASLITHNDTNNDIQNSFVVSSTILGSAYQLAKVLSGSLQIRQSLIGGNAVYTRGFLSENSTTGSRLVLFNIFSTRNTQPYAEYLIKIDGTNAFAVVTNLFNRARGANVSEEVPGGIGIWIRNGSQIRAQGVSLLGYDKAIWIENAGPAPVANFSGMLLDANTQCFVGEHPGTMGSFSGTLDGITGADASPYFTFLALDDGAVGTRITGDLYIGPSLDNQTNVTDLIRESSPTGLLSGGHLSAEDFLTVGVEAGYGYVSTPNSIKMKRVEWSAGTIDVPDNSISFIYINNNGEILRSGTGVDPFEHIILGYCQARNGGIYQLLNTPFEARHATTAIDLYLRLAIGPLVLDGLLVTEGSSPLKINVSDGTVANSTLTFFLEGGSDILFEPRYHSSGEWVYGPFSLTTLPTDKYDDGTFLVDITTGYYVTHALYASQNSLGTSFYLVYSQGEYATFDEAISAGFPTTPPDSISWVPVALFVVQEGGTSVEAVIDIRPQINRIQQVLSSSTPLSDHGSLTGLLDDDHPQYLRADGTRALTGNLNLNSNNIINVGTINSISITSHGSRHNPNGADPITTATAVELSPSSTNTAGTANSLARSDHTHRIDGFQPLDATLTALAAYNTNGFLVQTAADTFAGRSLIAPAAGFTITNNTGVGGNPTFVLANDLNAVEGLTTTGFAVRTATDTWATRTITAGTNIAVSDGDGIFGNPTISFSGTLPISSGGTGQTTANAALNALLPSQTGNNTRSLVTNGTNTSWADRVSSINITAPAAGITASGGPITTSGSITLALANDLAAVEGLTGTGFAVRTATDTWATRTITGGTNIAVTNGDGVSANPSIAITGTVGVSNGGTGLSTAPANGQLLIGNGTNYTLNTLTAGTGITITNAPGAITIASTAGKYRQILTGSIPVLSGTTTYTTLNDAPPITAGTQLWTQDITTGNSSSRIEIEFTLGLDSSNNDRNLTFAIFRNTTCIMAVSVNSRDPGRVTRAAFYHVDTPGAIATYTYSARVATSGNTWFINQNNAGAQTYGGLTPSGYKVAEILP